MNFETVYQDQYARVRGFCLWKLKNHDDADEVTQEVFLRLFKSWDRLEDRCPIGFLINTAKWVISHKWKADHAKRRIPYFEPLTDTIPDKRVMSDPLPTRLLDMIWKLQRLQRRAVVMHYYADMTFEEIGQAMGTGISTAEYRTKAGVKKLREQLCR